MARLAAWNQGRTLLERGIAQRLDFAFATTLGDANPGSLLKGTPAWAKPIAAAALDLHLTRR